MSEPSEVRADLEHMRAELELVSLEIGRLMHCRDMLHRVIRLLEDRLAAEEATP